MPLPNLPDEAAMSLNADGTVVYQRGCTGAKSSTGVYTCTLPSPGIAAAEAEVMCQMIGAAWGFIRVAHTSDTVKTISTVNIDGTTAADKAFNLSIKRRAVGSVY